MSIMQQNCTRNILRAIEMLPGSEMPYVIDHVKIRTNKLSLINYIEKFCKIPAQLVVPEFKNNMYLIAGHKHTGMQRKYGLILCNA